IGHVVAEERIGLGERATPDDDFRAALRDRVQGGEPLEDAYRVVGAENRDGGAKMNVCGPRGDRGEDDFGCRDGKVRAVVFADADEGQADLVGELSLLD